MKRTFDEYELHICKRESQKVRSQMKMKNSIRFGVDCDLHTIKQNNKNSLIEEKKYLKCFNLIKKNLPKDFINSIFHSYIFVKYMYNYVRYIS